MKGEVTVKEPVPWRRWDKAQDFGSERRHQIGVAECALAGWHANGRTFFDAIVETVQVHGMLDPRHVDDAKPYGITLREREPFGVRKALAVDDRGNLPRLPPVGLVEEPLADEKDVVVGARARRVDDDRTIELRVQPQPVFGGRARKRAPIRVGPGRRQTKAKFARRTGGKLDRIAIAVGASAQPANDQR